MADKDQAKKPRIRKVETVRERNQKASERAEKKANKTPKRRVRRAASAAAKPIRAVAKPLSKPASIIAWPFRMRPVRFVGRILGRILWPRYFRNSWKEIRQVTWPSRRVTWNLTVAVLIFALVFGLTAAGVDWVLDKIIRRIVFRA